jgi:hypothetical protein
METPRTLRAAADTLLRRGATKPSAPVKDPHGTAPETERPARGRARRRPGSHPGPPPDPHERVKLIDDPLSPEPPEEVDSED